MNDSIFKRHFLLTAGMILLSFVLLGAAFMTLSYQYAIRDQKESLDTKADYMAAVTAQVLERELFINDEECSRYIETAAKLTDSDVMFCDVKGQIMLACGKDGIKEQWIGHQVPMEVIDQVMETGDYESVTNLNVFSERRFISGAPVVVTIEGVQLTWGCVLVSVSTDDLTEMWQVFSTIFFFTAVVVLCIAFISSSISSLQQTRPIQNMTAVVRRFGMGEYDLRVEDRGRSDEVGELARAFNAMADSIACAEQKRSEFVANISHELKTPMTTIAGFADGILDGTIPPERHREYLKTISDETRRLSRLVRRMLDLSRMQSKEIVLSQTEFDIVETMAQVMISLEGKINSRQLDIDARFPDNSTIVWGDPDAITQVCYNLMDNAIKFAHPGTMICVSITTKGGKAYISVKDQGETIPEEEQSLIFDRLHKSDRSRSLDKEGVGLGLYLVKTILSDLKETITVSSKDGITEFVFTLTLAR